MIFNPFHRKQKTNAEPTQKTQATGLRVEKTAEKKTFPALVEKPHTTEKASALAMANHYVFRVDPRTNKPELKKVIERHYGVHVEAVRIMNILGKQRRVKGMRGWKPGYKKAIVAVRAGEKIETDV